MVRHYVSLTEYLKAELKKAGVGYKELAERLTAMGLPESEGSITVKINRGGVSSMVSDRRNGIDWRSVFAPRLIAGVVVVTLMISLGLLAITWGYSEQTRRQWDSDQNSAEYTAYTYGPAYDACVRLPDNRHENCKAQASEKRRANERDEQDIVAQQTSAIWAFLMGAAAIIGMVLSAIGVVLIWTTFHETKKGAAASESAAKAAWTIGMAQVEPIFAVGNPAIGTYDNPEMPFQANWNIRNMGKTPAFDVSAEFVWKIVDRQSLDEWGGRLKLDFEDNIFPSEAANWVSGPSKIDIALLDGMTPETCSDADIIVDVHISCTTIFRDRLEVIWRRKAWGQCVGMRQHVNVLRFDTDMGAGGNAGSIIHHARTPIKEGDG